MGETDGSHAQDAPNPWKDLHSWMSYKRMESGRFVWPPIVDGKMLLTPAQLTLLIEAMDWRRTVAAEVPRKPVAVG
jgi:transposase